MSQPERSPHSRWRVFIRALVLLIACLPLMAPLGAVAQDVPEDEAIEVSTVQIRDVEPPKYLKPVAKTADLNLLGMMFGDIARAASGQISLADTNMTDPAGEHPTHQTDSVLAAANFVYMLGILGFLAILILALSIFWLINSGMEGKALTQRYNMWIPIRAAYAIIALVPVLGGWSFGQYGILNATFFVNGITNEIHKTTNQWVYTHEGVLSPAFHGYHYRDTVQNIYLAEICSQIANRYLDKEQDKLSEEKAQIDARLANDDYGYKIDQKVFDEYRSMLLSSSAIEKYVGKVLVKEAATEDGSRINVHQPDIPGSTPIISENMGHSVNRFTYGWGSEDSTPTACGKISLNIAVPKVKETTGTNGDIASSSRRRAFVKAYWEAHASAIETQVERAHDQVEATLNAIETVVDNHSATPYKKEELRVALAQLADNNELVGAFGGAFTDLGTLTSTLWKSMVRGETSSFAELIRNAYNKNTGDAVKEFNQQLEQLTEDMRSGAQADYGEPASEEEATPYDSLVENTAKGWMYAGFKWWDLSHANSFQMELMRHRPVNAMFSSRLSDHNPAIETLLTRFKRKLVHLNKLSQPDHSSETITQDDVLSKEAISQWAEDAEDDTKGAMETFSHALSQWLLAKMINGAYDFKSTDLLANLQNAGHNYLATGEILWAATRPLNVAIGAAEGSQPIWFVGIASGMVKAILKMAVEMLVWTSVVFLVAGFVMAIYLPMLPAILWTFGLIGWLEKLISLIINFGPWMAGHIIPDADGVVNGVGRQGYILLASVLLRPPIMVLSLNISMMALAAFGFFLDDFASVFIPSTSSGYVNGLVTILSQFAVFTVFIVIVCHMFLAWIWKIPDEAKEYISGGQSNHGEGEGKAHLQGAVGHIGSKTEQIGGSMQGGGGGGKNPNTTPSGGGGGSGASPSGGGGSGGGNSAPGKSKDFF